VIVVKFTLETPRGIPAQGTRPRPGTDLPMDAESMLFNAIEADDLNAVKELLEKGVEVSARDDRGQTPLMFAAWMSNTPEIVQLLLDKGAEIEARDEGGETPLSFATRNSSTPEIVTLLLENGAEVNVKSNLGSTPLIWAAFDSSFPEIVTMLLEKGADPLAKMNGRKAIYLAQWNVKLKGTPAFQELKKASKGWWPFG
jgi:ankyrin repeat protein